MNYPGYFAPQHALCTDEIENLRGSLRESMDLTKQYYDASINVARARDAALVRARDLETAQESLLTLLRLEPGQSVTLDGLFCVAGGRWIAIQEAAAALAAATQEAAGAGEPNLLVIDTTNAQMVQMPNTTAAASSMPSSWRPASAPPAPRDGEQEADWGATECVCTHSRFLHDGAGENACSAINDLLSCPCDEYRAAAGQPAQDASEDGNS